MVPHILVQREEGDYRLCKHPGLENTNRLTSLISLTSLAVFF